jgi:hypothetical protein
MSAEKSRPLPGAAPATGDDDKLILTALPDKTSSSNDEPKTTTAALSVSHARQLEEAAIPAEFARRHGIRSVERSEDLPAELSWAGRHEGAIPGLLFPWTGTDGQVSYQLRPDSPFALLGKPTKYLQPKGIRLLNVMGDIAGAHSVWIVEGTKQAFAAAACAPEGILVVGIPGCRGWSSMRVLRADLAALVANRKVIATLDADVETNPRVRAAASAMMRALTASAATDVRYARTPGDGTAGLDDVLGQTATTERPKLVLEMLLSADTLLPALNRGQSPQSASAEEPQVPRPVINVTDDRFQVITDVVGSLQNRWDGTRLFNYGGVLAELEGSMTRTVDKGRLLLLLAESAQFVRRTRNGSHSHGWPDNGVLEAVLASPERFAPLESVTLIPFVREDGTICQTPGYDRLSRTFLVRPQDNLAGVDVPDHPSRQQVEAAVELLLTEWLGDFQFDSQADRANALALILTPFVRRLTDLVPLAVVDGVAPGVGKNLLADCLSIVVTGDPSQPLPYHSNDEETRKVITSTFESGASLRVFDEAHVIGGHSLARALTSIVYTDRILGSSRMVRYPNSATWVALGNNVRVFGDVVRRVYRIAIRPVGPKPENRPATAFRHFDLSSWTRQNRHRLVEAVLTLVRAWFVAGQPSAYRDAGFGSFESWDRVVGGILQVAGVEGFLDNLEHWRSETDHESDAWTAHLEQLLGVFGEATFTTAEAVESITTGRVRETPPWLEDMSKPGYGRELGKAYGRANGRWFGKVRITRAGTPGAGGAHGSVNRWALGTSGGPPRGGSEGSEESGSATREDSPSYLPPPGTAADPASIKATEPNPDPSHPSTQQVAVLFETGSAAAPLAERPQPSTRELTWRDIEGVIHSSSDPVIMRQVLTAAPALLTHDEGSVGLVEAARQLELPFAEIACKTRNLAIEARLADPPTYAKDQERYSLVGLSRRLLADVTEVPPSDDTPDRKLARICELGKVIVPPDAAYAGREARVAAVAGGLTLTGLRVDEPELRNRQAADAVRAEGLRVRLVDDYGFPSQTDGGQPSSHPWKTKAGGEIFLQLAADVKWPRQDNGAPVLNAESLAEGVARYAGTPLGEVCALILEAQAGNSFLADAAANLVSGRIHPRYDFTTVTGRWRSVLPNILGAGKRNAALLADRDVLLAEPGEVFIGIDLSGIDARCVAGLSGDVNYARMFDPGVDIHAELAELFLGDRDQREPAKAISHGINYGRGPRAIAGQSGRPLYEVQRMHHAYFERYPGIANWHRDVRRRGGAGAMLPTGTGRLVRVTRQNAYTEAPARLAQAAARDLAMTGVLNLIDAGLLPMLRLFIHDEVVLSVPEDRADDIAEQVAGLMSFDWTSPSGLTIPIIAEVGKGRGARWSDLYRD